MKKFLKRLIILFVICSIFCWLFGSFVLWEFDMAKWDVSYRLLVGLLSFLIPLVFSANAWYALERELD